MFGKRTHTAKPKNKTSLQDFKFDDTEDTRNSLLEQNTDIKEQEQAQDANFLATSSLDSVAASNSTKQQPPPTDQHITSSPVPPPPPAAAQNKETTLSLSEHKEIPAQAVQQVELSTKSTKKQVIPPAATTSLSSNTKKREKKFSQSAASRIVKPMIARTNEFMNMKSSIYTSLIETIDVSRVAQMEKDDAAIEIAEICTDIIAARGYLVGSNEQDAIIDEICDDILGYGPLEPLLARDDIADIMVNGPHQVFIETNGCIEISDIKFRDNRQLLEICQRMVSKVGRRVDEASPICDARLLDGSRINVIVPPLSVDGVNLTIRKFKKDKLKIVDLIKYGSIDKNGGMLLQLIGACRCNVIVSGGTGSGKTTLLNCLSSFAGDNERIVTCEDSAELQLQQPHVVRLETRPASLEGAGEVSMRDLVKNCLRMRPERIIVGEVRGPEAFDLLQAMNTGHDGSMGTLHANSPREAISRLEAMITMGGFGLPIKVIREMISGAVDIIVQTQRLRDGSRRITHITEVLNLEDSTIVTQDILKFETTGEDKNGKITGEHVSTGVGRPEFRERARDFNLDGQLDAIMDRLVSSGQYNE